MFLEFNYGAKQLIIAFHPRGELGGSNYDYG